MLIRLSVVVAGSLMVGLWSCKEIKPQIDTVEGSGDTNVDTVEVGTVGGTGGTTNVDTVNANINMGGLLGNPYTIIKTAQSVACANEQTCKCTVRPKRTGILVPKDNVFYVSKMNAQKTVFGCIMNSKVIKDASKYTVGIQPNASAWVEASPIGSAKTLEELNTAFK